MSSLREMTMKDALPLIKKLYESFGVKSLILAKDNRWINVVTVIHLTRRKVEDLDNEYRFAEKRLGRIDYDNFKIMLQARPISEFHRVVTELQKGFLNIGDLHTELQVKDPEKAFEREIHDPGNIVRSGEFAEYNYYGLRLAMDGIPDQTLHNFGIFPSSLGLRDFTELARSWLGLDNLSSSTNIHIVIPIYAKVKEIQYQGASEIKVTLKTDNRLMDSSYIWLTRKGQGDNAPLLERIRYDLASCDNTLQNGFLYTTLIHCFSAINLKDRISVSLLHDELGLLDRCETSVFSFPSETHDPFSRTFVLFDAGKKMETHLLNPVDAKDFEVAVSWLLENIGIRHFELGRDEAVRDNKTEKGSADIIAYDPESNVLFVIDCTIGVPSEPKIDKIRSTAEYISRKISYPVEAVIFTSRKAEATKDQARKCNVTVVDNTDLEKMIGFYKKGHSYPAKKVFLNIV